ncbi:MAG: hypothetical protein AAF902_12230 [Chloroflexota bacterium]
MDLFVYTFHADGNIHRALSVLDPNVVGDQGIPTESVLGEINAHLPSMTPDQFETNEAFINLLHEVVKQQVPHVDEYQEQSGVIATGILYIVDLRAGKITGETGEEDLIGQFTVRTGTVLPDSYIPNPSYKPLTNNGPIELHPIIESVLLDRVNKLLNNHSEEDHAHHSSH